MVHSKSKIQRLSADRLAAMIAFLLAYLKTYDPKAYRKAESIGGLRSSKRGKGKVTKGGGGKRTRKLRPGLHTVRVGGKERKVRVLANGQWQFVKMHG